MSQGNSSTFSKEIISATGRLSSPVGQNLTNVNTRTLTPSMGALAYGSDSNVLYFGSVDTWNVVAGPAGATGFTGPTGSAGPTGFGITGSTGQPGITSVGPFSLTSTANGATITSQVLTLYSADTVNPGGVNVTGQSFSGVKNFLSGASFHAALTPSVSKVLQYFDSKTYTGTFGGALAGLAGNFVFQRVGSEGFILSGTTVAQNSAGGIITYSTAVDQEFRTSGSGRNGMIFYILNSVFGIGVINVDNAGNITIGSSVNGAGVLQGFTVGQSLQLIDSAATYGGLVNY